MTHHSPPIASSNKYALAELQGVLSPGYSRTHTVINRLGTDIVVLLDPAMIRHCLVLNAGNYRQASARKRLMEPVLGKNSILTAEGDFALLVRRNLAGLFTRTSLERYSEDMVQETCKNLDRTESGVHRVSILAARLALRNLSRTLFSGALDASVDEIIEAIEDIYASIPGLPMVGEEGGLFFYPRIDRRLLGKAAERLRAITRGIVENRLSRGDGDNDREQNLLDRLIALQRENSEGTATLNHLVDDVVTFVFAGHETTASVVAWALYLLSQNEDALIKATTEANRLVEDETNMARWPEQLQYLLACVEETQRLFPPAPVFTRQAIADDSVNGVSIRANSVVMIPVRLIHRLHRFWCDPEIFRPERFLEEDRSSLNRSAFLPFGAGPRMCMGAAFGNREAVIILAAILRHFTPRYVGQAEPVPELKVIMRAANGIPMHLG